MSTVYDSNSFIHSFDQSCRKVQRDITQTDTDFYQTSAYNNEKLTDETGHYENTSHNGNYDLSTVYDSSNIDNSLNDVNSDVTHDDNLSSSMCAQTSLNLKWNSKGLKIGQINIQGIQNNLEQIDILLNHSNNDIHIF